jgi:hypothetical protein
MYKTRRYDVGGFIDAHPGGRDLIVQHENRDITDAYDDIGHSTDADQILAGYLRPDNGRASGAASVDDDESPSVHSTTVARGPSKPTRMRATTRILCALVGVSGLCQLVYHYGTWPAFLGGPADPTWPI